MLDHTEPPKGRGGWGGGEERMHLIKKKVLINQLLALYTTST